MDTAKEVIRRALVDAIEWQISLGQCWPQGSAERAECMAQVKLYRKMMKRRYGTARTPKERALDASASIGLDELRAMAESREKTTESL